MSWINFDLWTKLFYMDYLITICLVFALIGVKPPNNVKVTVYHIRGLTASGDHTDKIKEPFIAVSRDLLADYPMNTRVKLYDCPFEGEYIVKDKMNKRLHNMVDVFLPYTGKKYNPCRCKMQTLEDYNTPVPIELPIEVDSMLQTVPVDTLEGGKGLF